MGVHIHGSTIDGGLTPICNECGVSLCWDIGEDEYQQHKQFWDDWICQDCNGGVRMSRSQYYADATNATRAPMSNYTLDD